MNKLRLWRIERGLSQFELAEASGVSRWLIQLIETGIREPSPIQIENLSEALGIKSESLCPKQNQIRTTNNHEASNGRK